MIEIEEIDVLLNRINKYMFPNEIESDWIFDVWKRKRKQKKKEKENKKIKSQGIYGRIVCLDYLLRGLRKLENEVGYVPIIHEKVFLSEMTIDLGTLMEDKHVVSKLYLQPSDVFKNEFELVCFDDTNDSIAWTRVHCCVEFDHYSVVVQNNYGSKAEEMLKKQIGDGIDIAIEKYLAEGNKYLDKLEAKRKAESLVKEEKEQ